jgi:hypothetical protein
MKKYVSVATTNSARKKLKMVQPTLLSGVIWELLICGALASAELIANPPAGVCYESAFGFGLNIVGEGH